MAIETILITGATSGIGLAGTTEMARRGWRVLLHARNATNGAVALAKIKAELPQAQVEVVLGDLSTQSGVLALAAAVRERCAKLDVLWNNAGMMATKRQLTSDGWELQMAVNHLAPFTLTRALLPLVQAGGGGRIVGTASGSQAWGKLDFDNWMGEGKAYNPMGVYSKSKLCNVLFTRELASRYGDSGITAHCFHPGFVRSDIGKSRDKKNNALLWGLIGLFAIPPEKGADTGVFLATNAIALQSNGRFWTKRQFHATNPLDTPENAKRLWELTEKALTLKS